MMIDRHLTPMLEDGYITKEQFKRIVEMRFSKADDDRVLARHLAVSLRRQQLKELLGQLSPHNLGVLRVMSWYLTTDDAEVTDCNELTADEIVDLTSEGKLAWAIKECKQMLGR